MSYQPSDPQDWVFPTKTTLQCEVRVLGTPHTLVLEKLSGRFRCYIKGTNEYIGDWTDVSEKGLKAFKRSIAAAYGTGSWQIVTETK